MHRRLLLGALLFGGIATARAQEAAPEAKPPVLTVLRDEATHLLPLVQSPLAQAFLAAVPDLPATPGTRTVFYNRDTRDVARAVAETAFKQGIARADYVPYVEG